MEGDKTRLGEREQASGDMNNERLEDRHVQKRLLSSLQENSLQPRSNKNWLEGMCQICASIKLIWKCFESSSRSFLTPLIGFLESRELSGRRLSIITCDAYRMRMSELGFHLPRKFGTGNSTKT
jgi:hypothetical protein